MKKWVIFGGIAAFLLTGCVPKINPNEYAHVNAPKSKYMPSKTELYSKTQVLIVPFDGKKYKMLDEAATAKLKTILVNYPPVKVVNRKFEGMDKEIKLAEEAKSSGTNLNQADYVIKGKIISASTNSIYHEATYWRDKKGRLHRNPPYYENKACVQGELNIIKVPENTVVTTQTLEDCEIKNTSTRMTNFNSLLTEAAQEAVEDKKEFLYNLFAKKGYVYEVRRKDDEEILHVTLGKNDGAEPGLKVNIYTIKEQKTPFDNKVTKEEVKIGEGTISNEVNPNDSWVVVDSKKEEIKIGDFVKPVHQKSLLKSVGKFLKSSVVH